jgi:NAD+ kinase
MRRIRKIGIYGGSFRPPGLHHRQIAIAVASFFDKLYVIPCGTRKDKATTALTKRIDCSIMVGQTFSDLHHVELNMNDLVLDSFTPTWLWNETYEKIGEVWHVVGPDLIEGGANGQAEIQRTWEKGKEIWNSLNFAVVVPANCGLDKKDLPPNHMVIEMKEELVTHSRAIREKIATGQPFEGLVMPKVATYIKKIGLYGCKQ